MASPLLLRKAGEGGGRGRVFRRRSERRLECAARGFGLTRAGQHTAAQVEQRGHVGVFGKGRVDARECAFRVALREQILGQRAQRDLVGGIGEVEAARQHGARRSLRAAGLAGDRRALDDGAQCVRTVAVDLVEQREGQVRTPERAARAGLDQQCVGGVGGLASRWPCQVLLGERPGLGPATPIRFERGQRQSGVARVGRGAERLLQLGRCAFEVAQFDRSLCGELACGRVVRPAADARIEPLERVRVVAFVEQKPAFEQIAVRRIFDLRQQFACLHAIAGVHEHVGQLEAQGVSRHRRVLSRLQRPTAPGGRASDRATPPAAATHTC